MAIDTVLLLLAAADACPPPPNASLSQPVCATFCKIANHKSGADRITEILDL